MAKKISVIITLILIFSFVLRITNLTFPSFTAEEARIASRGYSLARVGSDELGRRFPVVFNSLDDYQLPVVSYLTMIGIAFFGKNDLGARLPFILIGTLVVLLTYKISKSFSKDDHFRLISAFIVATSPTLIFLSKIPNEAIILCFILILILHLLVSNKSLWLVTLAMMAAVFISKLAWFILLPYLLYILWFYNQKKQPFLTSVAVAIVLSSFLLFLSIPQSKRSLIENNFSLFSDITIGNAINRLRGQGIESGWPALIDKLLFNKSHFLIAGLVHWLSHLDPALYFGQFDKSGKLSFSYLGTWVKILMIPFAVGVFKIIQTGDRRNRSLFLLFLILTYPAIFIYPIFSLELIILILPYMALIIASGLTNIIKFNKKIALLIFCLLIFELALNLYNLSPEYKNTNTIRPGWVKQITIDVFHSSQTNQIAISDDFVADITTFINWYTPLGDKVTDFNIAWPYRFRQYNLSNIKVIGHDNEFRPCGINEKLTIFVSQRDLNKIQHEFQVKASKSYQDSLQQDQVFLIPEGICLD